MIYVLIADGVSSVVECCFSLGLGCVLVRALKQARKSMTESIETDIVVDNCAICRNHIMDLCACFRRFLFDCV